MFMQLVTGSMIKLNQHRVGFGAHRSLSLFFYQKDLDTFLQYEGTMDQILSDINTKLPQKRFTDHKKQYLDLAIPVT